jgi:hypothetical protein
MPLIRHPPAKEPHHSTGTTTLSITRNAMIFLTEISLKRSIAVDVTLTFDPLVAADFDYCLKTWMASVPDVSCRPWRATPLREGARITGWRRDAPKGGSRDFYTGARPVSFAVGERVTFATRFIALRRNPRGSRDAADGRTSPVLAYTAWLNERLIDISPAASTEAITIEHFALRRVLRKVAKNPYAARVSPELIPVVDATVAMTVKNTARLEEWLLVGIGPQKGFGYGAFLPVPEMRAAW